MAEIPIPADVYFRDFAFDVVKYEVKRKGTSIAVVDGLPNEEDGEKYIHIPHGSDVAVGDILLSDGFRTTARKISTDTYQGKPALLKVYF